MTNRRSTALAAAASLALALALGSPGAARADADVDDVPAPRPSHSVFGLALDAGVPDFAGVSLLVRPLRFLRLHAGVRHDVAAYGFRGGISIQPHWFIAPSLGLEFGRFFEADAAAKLRAVTTVPAQYQAGLQHFGYNFASATAGLEIGNPDGLSFFVRAGVSRVMFTSRDTAAALERAVADVPQLKQFVRVQGSDAVMPTVKAGVLMHF
jgi:opacity protein-like surface antigen